MIEETVFQQQFPQGQYRDVLLSPQREVIWEQPWQPNLIAEGFRRVLAALVRGEGDSLNFWAVGTGQEEWDSPTAELPDDETRRQLIALYNEIRREAISPDDIIFVGGSPTEPTNQLEISVAFTIAEDAGEAETQSLREFGLFAGGSIEPNSGVMINHRIHPRIDLQPGFTLQRTLLLTF